MYCLRSLSEIGWFSFIALVFTFVAVVLILIITIQIAQKTPQEVEDENHVHISDSSRDFVMFNALMLPVVAATLKSLFEGNQQILNVYAEA